MNNSSCRGEGKSQNTHLDRKENITKKTSHETSNKTVWLDKQAVHNPDKHTVCPLSRGNITNGTLAYSAAAYSQNKRKYQGTKSIKTDNVWHFLKKKFTALYLMPPTWLSGSICACQPLHFNQPPGAHAQTIARLPLRIITGPLRPFINWLGQEPSERGLYWDQTRLPLSASLAA